MFKKSKVCTGVLVALGSTLLALPAFAQTSDRVEITGSRIKALSTDTASPIISLRPKPSRSPVRRRWKTS